MPNGKQPKILIVDDEPNILIALEFLFERQGFAVQKAFDGLQALEKYHTFQPDVVFLDVMMPVMNGYEVAKRIRHTEGSERVRIFFLTAKDARLDKVEGYRNGADFYLTKPFDNDEVVQLLTEALTFG